MHSANPRPLNPEASDIDPITLEIWWSRLIAIADEAATALLRTAFSTIVRESNDFATVLLNARGESIAECSGGIPAFAGILPRTARAILAKFPPGDWREGDCVITNDPWIATGHLPDIALLTPIFHRGRVVGFAACAAHSPDIGGSASPATRELFEEGLCVPPMHLYRAGQRNDAMLALFLNNVRLPEQVLGDLEAQVTANKVCARRAVDFLEDAGLPDFEQLSRAVHERSELAMRQAIAAIPDGCYTSEIEADGVDGQPTRIRCAVTVDGERLRVDYAGTSAQVDKAINCTMNYTQAYSVYPLKCAIDPLSRRNEGTYRPIEVSAPEGSIVNARHPAPVGARHLTGHLLCCALYQALAPVLPGRVLADSGGSPALRVGFAGVDSQGTRFTQILFASGGMGASAQADGLSTTAFPTNSGAGSIEALEAVAPLLVEQKTFRTDSGGAGRQRGGLGQDCVIRNLAGRPIRLGILGDRERHPALGLAGGRAGAPTRAHLQDGTPLNLKSVTGLGPGQAVTLQFAGGGGFGPPQERERAAVQRDLDSGFITAEAAARDHGFAAAEGQAS